MFSLLRNKSDKGKGRGGQTFHVFLSFLSCPCEGFCSRSSSRGGDSCWKVVIHVGIGDWRGGFDGEVVSVARVFEWRLDLKKRR